MSSDDDTILKLVGRYRLVTRGVAAQVVGSEAKADKLLGRLVKGGLLAANKRLPGNRTVYQLSRKGAGRVGLGESRARVHGAQAMLKHLGVLLYCYGGKDQAYRLEDEELPLVAPGLPPGAYCIAKSKDRAVVFACYVPSTTASAESVMRRLRRMHAELAAVPALQQLVRDGRLGLAVLVESGPRRRALMDAVRRPEGRRGPLVKSIRVRVVDVPGVGKFFGAPPRAAAGGGASLWDAAGDPEVGL